jgi:hypothetical protein
LQVGQSAFSQSDAIFSFSAFISSRSFLILSKSLEKVQRFWDKVFTSS